METIAVVDTSICTDNLGDEIIMDAVNEVMWEMFPTAYIFRVPSHERLSDRTHAYLRKARWCFIGGTNLLSSRITPRGLWRIGPQDADQFAHTETVCVGTGWNDYMDAVEPATAAILKQALSPRLSHSVRDRYTRDHLASLGLSAASTSCLTTWGLTPEHCATIPRRKAPDVVFTLSAWRRDEAADRAFVDVLSRHYRHLYFFPQMQDDWAYCESFGWPNIRMVHPTSEGYTRFLQNEDVDFVGTRLHGGIRALQSRRRALVLSIDNRAAEIGKDINLPVEPRDDATAIERWVVSDAATEIHLPQAEIDAWKHQFKATEQAAKPPPRTPLGQPTMGMRARAKAAVNALRGKGG